MERVAILGVIEDVFGPVFVCSNEPEDDEMGLVDILKGQGYKPEPNQDLQFEPLIGHYRTTCEVLRPDIAKQSGDHRWHAEFYVQEVLEGTHVDTTGTLEKRRRFFKNYEKNEEGLKKLLNDFFTMGVTFKTDGTDEEFEASFVNAIGKDAYIRAWAWTPDKKQDGTPIPEHEREPRQQYIIKPKAQIKLGTAKPKGDAAPF